jgi:hypothetical protein
MPNPAFYDENEPSPANPLVNPTAQPSHDTDDTNLVSWELDRDNQSSALQDIIAGLEQKLLDDVDDSFSVVSLGKIHVRIAEHFD